MYGYLLVLHSYMRWLVVILLVGALIFSFINKKKQAIYTIRHYKAFNFVKHCFNIQFIIGLVLLVQSPLVRIFWKQIVQAVKWREIRFFGLEHPFMMILSIVLLNLFTHKSKTKLNTTKGFVYLFTVYCIILFLLFVSVPWSFSPFTSRPNFRFF
ncbi:hypothetical protein H1R17_03640 [Flavobacterium sp. xlx-214]|uniref:hypothetical protein n=1 Tax=unclassified Flavobacterium TaxID=196869 RepID=UPI0013D4DC91|nr:MULTISPECIES: hypothetical protein [unclassified Flavobacterium]MBA5791983.1 hypothetical protein [Flavobacterium sp. xlx-221]QMI84237.1 hypothetical protein H1R17_03640 [Flavobacterium sp. xlx-214]